MENCNPAAMVFPSESKIKLAVKDCPEEPVQELTENYRKLLGSFQWLQTMMHQDLGYYVSELLRFLPNPGKTHMDTALHLLRYTKGTKLLGLKYKRNGGGLMGFSDSDWASCINTRK